MQSNTSNLAPTSVSPARTLPATTAAPATAPQVETKSDLLNIDLSKLTSAQLATIGKQVATVKRVKVEEEAKNKPYSPRGRGVMAAIKTVVYKNPTLTGDALLAAVRNEISVADKDGRKTSKSVVDTARSDFINSIRVLKELGALKDEVAKRF